ncbi:MAG TPA: acyclic terpene utilization AtuA family protein [Bacteroidota bacterium]|nr:acyclic terpene utilization AtuA family protein [Bacteroidota bacterium]
MKPSIRIASGQGFWGDLLNAPVDQVRKGPIDYLVMDYLAEVTMSILQKQKLKDPALGYARDLVPLIAEILPDIVSRGIRIITNGGGVNPIACRDALFAVARQKGVHGLKIGVVRGDDILLNVDELIASGATLANMETGEPLSSIRKRLISANVYFGAAPIVEALEQGAQIVITGRTTDTGLTLAPMIHEFGWKMEDWDRLASGTVAGHILECGAQASGGNFLADWKSVPDLAHVGFPIAEAFPDGTFVITKHQGTGGLVSEATVKEQLLYELGDPTSYITPDCVADFTTIRLEQTGRDHVRVWGVKGRPATEFYKVSMAYHDGYTAVGTLTYAWPDAVEKARAADRILRTRLADLGLSFEEVRTELLGIDSCFGPRAAEIADPNEVVLRIGVRGQDRDAVERFGREIAPLILTGPPSVTGFAGGRPRPSEVVAYWPALIRKSLVSPIVETATL